MKNKIIFVIVSTLIIAGGLIFHDVSRYLDDQEKFVAKEMCDKFVYLISSKKFSEAKEYTGPNISEKDLEQFWSKINYKLKADKLDFNIDGFYGKRDGFHRYIGNSWENAVLSKVAEKQQMVMFFRVCGDNLKVLDGVFGLKRIKGKLRITYIETGDPYNNP